MNLVNFQSEGAGPKAGIVACAVYAGGKRVADCSIEEVGKWAKRKHHVVWIGLVEPNEEILEGFQRQLNLHELAIEDASKPHQRPKIDQYGDALFIVVRTAQMSESSVRFGEIHIFVGPGYVLTVRHGSFNSLADVRARLETCPKLLANGEDYILYAILDSIVDNYLPVVDAINQKVEAAEENVFDQEFSLKEIERLYKLRRELLRLRNAAVPLAEVCRKLEHAEVGPIDSAMQFLYRDVMDHLSGIQEEIDVLREVVSFAFEANLMTGQAQQTQITRRLAAWAAMLAVPTAIAGIYGMNFENIPELSWRYGYFVIMGIILTVCIGLYLRFRKNQWL